MQILTSSKVHNGTYKKYSHFSKTLDCEMKFSVFDSGSPYCLVFLSGLTCNEDNFITKANAIKRASELGITLICPDTSPRIGQSSKSWWIGPGAGFYVNATNPGYTNYQMFSYINDELYGLVKELYNFTKCSIFGHSMGGHGALISCFKTSQYASVSAFAPISNPTVSKIAGEAFSAYFDKSETGLSYDATELAKTYNGSKISILIDQGTADSFYKDGELLVDNFVTAARANPNIDLNYRLQEGFDHGYWFVQTFINDHIDFHYKFLAN
jgi:S-formylglutathione hydrolase